LFKKANSGNVGGNQKKRKRRKWGTRVREELGREKKGSILR